jgi:hypothetical protein
MLFTIVLIITLAGSTVYAAEGVSMPSSSTVQPTEVSSPPASYPDFNFTVHDITSENSSPPDDDMLSINEAAEAGAKYMYDIYGESAGGHALWMSYMSGRNQWAGRVTELSARLKAGGDTRGMVIFSFIIDAGSGTRIRILDMRETDLPEENSITFAEILDLKNKTPDDLEKFEQLAEEAAKKHFYDDKLVSLDYNGIVGVASGGGVLKSSNIGTARGRTLERVIDYQEMILSFVVTDTSGREVEITIGTETKTVKEIADYISEAELEARRAER